MRRANPPSDRFPHSVARLLLSHHPPEHLHRTVAVGGVHLCARCLGMVTGLGLVLLAMAVGVLPAAWRQLGPWCMLPLMLPAVIDFHGQLMRAWESTNLRRLATGVAFGAALALGLRALADGRWPASLVVPCGLTVYFVWLAAGRRRLVRMLCHLRSYAAYYERCRAEDARRSVPLAFRKAIDPQKANVARPTSGRPAFPGETQPPCCIRFPTIHKSDEEGA